MRAAVEGVIALAPEAIMACWSLAGMYDNPTVEPASTGTADMRACGVKLCDAVQARWHQLIVDQVPVGGQQTSAKWHAEPADGATSIHAADLDKADQFIHVGVYPRS